MRKFSIRRHCCGIDSARGTFSQDGQIRKENFWQTTAAWRALVKDGKIALWQVFTDNKPIREIIEGLSTIHPEYWPLALSLTPFIGSPCPLANLWATLGS